MVRRLEAYTMPYSRCMMTPWNGNTCRVTDPLWGNPPVIINGQKRGLWCFLWCEPKYAVGFPVIWAAKRLVWRQSNVTFTPQVMKTSYVVNLTTPSVCLTSLRLLHLRMFTNFRLVISIPYSPTNLFPLRHDTLPSLSNTIGKGKNGRRWYVYLK